MNCWEAIDLMGDSLEGTLDVAKRPAFEDHLEECPPCHTYFTQLATTVRTIGQIPTASSTGPGQVEMLEHFRREMRGEETEQ